MNIAKFCWKLTYIYNDKNHQKSIHLYCTDYRSRPYHSRNLDPVLFDSFAAGRLAIDLSILNIIIGTVILVVAVVGLLGICREMKKLLLVVSIRQR